MTGARHQGAGPTAQCALQDVHPGRPMPHRARKSRGAQQAPRHVAHLSRAAQTAWSRRSAPAREWQFRSGGTCPALLSAFPGRHEPRASRAYHAPARRKRPESQRNCRHAARARAHTPTARWSVPAPPHAGHCRADPRTAAPSSRHTQTRAAPFTSRADHQKQKRSVRDVRSLRLSATSPSRSPTDRETIQQYFIRSSSSA